MSEQTITDLAEVRPGDWVKVEYPDRDRARPFEGEAWEDRSGNLRVGSSYIRLENGEESTFACFISATRPAPALPTEPGSVILASKVGDVRLDPPVVMIRGSAYWRSAHRIGRQMWHGSDDVQEWVPAEVVAK